MTFAEFRAAVRKIAGGSYFAVSVEVSEYQRISPEPTATWKAYVLGLGNFAAMTPEGVVGQLVGSANVDGIDPIDPTEPDASPAELLSGSEPLGPGQ